LQVACDIKIFLLSSILYLKKIAATTSRHIFPVKKEILGSKNGVLFAFFIYIDYIFITKLKQLKPLGNKYEDHCIQIIKTSKNFL
jgi:hypothetical protein